MYLNPNVWYSSTLFFFGLGWRMSVSKYSSRIYSPRLSNRTLISGCQTQNVTLHSGPNSEVCRWIELRMVHCRPRLGNSCLLQELATDDARVASGLFKNADCVIGQEKGQYETPVLVFRILGVLESQQHRAAFTLFYCYLLHISLLFSSFLFLFFTIFIYNISGTRTSGLIRFYLSATLWIAHNLHCLNGQQRAQPQGKKKKSIYIYILFKLTKP